MTLYILPPILTTGLLAVTTLFAVGYGFNAVGIFLFKWLANLDHEFAPEVNLGNTIGKLALAVLRFVREVRPIPNCRIEEYENKFIIFKEKDDSGDSWYYSRDFTTSDYIWRDSLLDLCKFDSEEEAREAWNNYHCRIPHYTSAEALCDYGFLFKCSAIVDLAAISLSLLFSFVPMITIITSVVGVLAISIRSLAGRFYTGMHNHDVRIEDHDHRLNKLENKEDK